jgi:hypothetical protein
MNCTGLLINSSGDSQREPTRHDVSVGVFSQQHGMSLHAFTASNLFHTKSVMSYLNRPPQVIYGAEACRRTVPICGSSRLKKRRARLQGAKPPAQRCRCH